MSNFSGSLLRWLLVLIVIFCGCAALPFLKVSDNALNMLPDGEVRSELELLQRFGLVDRLFITLHADPTLSQSSAKELLQKSGVELGKLMAGNDKFRRVQTHFPKGFELQLYQQLFTHLPLLLDDKAFLSVQNMVSAQAIEEALKQDFMLLNSPAGVGMKEQLQRDPLGFSRVLLTKLKYLQAEFSVNVENGFFISKDGHNLLILAESSTALTDSKFCEELESELLSMYQKALQPGITATLVGAMPHTLANSRTVKNDLRLLLPIASILLLLLLAVSFRNWRAAIVFAIPFFGAIPAVVLTSMIFGQISIMAMGFGIVILGIAVDFSVHLYVALSLGDGSAKQILNHLRKPVLFAALTTLAVLAVLFFSVIPAQRQMATLAFFGVLFGILFAWLLVPTIIPNKKRAIKKGPSSLFFTRWIERKTKHPRIVLSLWGCFLLLALFAWPHLHYSGELRILDVAATTPAEKLFEAIWGHKIGDNEESAQLFAVTRGASLAEALNENSHLFGEALKLDFPVVQSVAAFLPGPDLQEVRRQRWNDFWIEQRPAFDDRFIVAAEENGFTAQAFTPFFDWLDHKTPPITIEGLQDTVLNTLLQSLISESDSETLILTIARASEKQIASLLGFADKHSDISVIANQFWRAEVERALKNDMLKLSASAGLLVCLLVTLLFREFSAVCATLAPVLSALAAMAVFTWLTGATLNIMHLVTGIMVIGLSVDYGIFVVSMKKGEKDSTTAFAITICAASSLIGFGVLAFATHPVLRALGTTVLVGIGAAWPAALLISPILLRQRRV